MMNARRVCVLGGTGFVGRHLASRLAAEGYQVTVLSRRPQRHRDLQVLPQVRLFEADPHQVDQLLMHFGGCEAVVNLVGILNEAGRDGSGFHKAHVELTKTVVEAAGALGIGRLLHMSALNADAAGGPSHYLRTKGEAEDLAHAAASSTTLVTSFRPSVIFGPDDSFFNRFAALLRLAPGIFPLACPDARFAPVYVGDVVELLVTALHNPDTYGQRYDLCGPHQYTLRELVEYTATTLGIRRKVLGLPDWAARLQAHVMGLVPGKPFSLDNYLSLSVDSVCKNGAPCPTPVAAIVPYYLGRGQRDALYQRFRSVARRS